MLRLYKYSWAINGVSKYINTVKPYQLDIGRAMGL